MPSGTEYPSRNSLVRTSVRASWRADRALTLQRREVARRVRGADAQALAVALFRPLVKIDALDALAAVDQPPHAGALDLQDLRGGLRDLGERRATSPAQDLRVHQIGERLATRVDLAFDVAVLALVGGSAR
jgi:hypothetical protein